VAQFSLQSFIDVGTKGYHTATSWKVCYDRAGKRIIDQSLNDTNNLYHWISPLPDGKGGMHADLNRVYLFVRVHILQDASPWYYVGWANQNDQTFKITENGNVINTLNSLVAGIQ